VDGRLGEPDRSRVVAHLTECPECLADYDSQLSLKGMLGDLQTPSAPMALRGKLSDLLAQTPAEPVPSGHHVGLPAQVRAAAMVIGAATLGGGCLAGGSPDGQPVVPPVDQYVREHAAVSVGVPLSAPVLYQLLPAPSAMAVSNASVPFVPAAAPTASLP